MWEKKWKMKWMGGFTWECSSSKAKFLKQSGVTT